MSKRRKHFESLRPEDRLGDEPIEASVYETMVTVSKGLDEIFNGPRKGQDKATGFVLLTFPYGDKSGRCNYVSNGANRQDIVTMFKEMIARFEGQAMDEGNA